MVCLFLFAVNFVQCYSFSFSTSWGFLLLTQPIKEEQIQNHVKDDLMKVFNIQHRFTTAYHPQANGIDKRLNQTLAGRLSKFDQDDRETWDAIFSEVVYAYDRAVQDTTRYRPFEAMFERVPWLSIDFNDTSAYAAVTKQQEYQVTEALKLL